MHHKNESGKSRSSDSLIYFKRFRHPVSGMLEAQAFLRYQRETSILVAWSTEDYDSTAKKMMYRVFESGSGKELCPPCDNLKIALQNIRTHERKFIEREMKYQEEYRLGWRPRMLTNRLKQLDSEQRTSSLQNALKEKAELMKIRMDKKHMQSRSR